MLSCLVGKRYCQNETSIISEGRYIGKNVYVQNPFDGNGSCCCVTSVEVNGKITNDSISNTAFEVELKNSDLELGDSIIVKIRHKTDCLPRILNPDQFGYNKNVPNDLIVDFEYENDTIIFCLNDHDYKYDSIRIERYKWNKWQLTSSYFHKPHRDTIYCLYGYCENLHSGENKIRFQFFVDGRPSLSENKILIGDLEPIKAKYDKKLKKIIFNKKTEFQVFDTFGNMLVKGFDDQIDCSDYSRGIYYLNFDNTEGDIISIK